MTFNIMDHLAGRSYPEKTVKVFFDERNMRRVVELDLEADSTVDQARVVELEKEIAELRGIVEQTALTFHLRGIPQDVKDALAKKAAEIEDEKERGQFQDVSALEASTVEVTNHAGDKATFDYDSLTAIAKALPRREWEVLIGEVVALSYEAVLYERVETNPDF